MNEEIRRIVSGPPGLNQYGYAGVGGTAMSESDSRSSGDFIPRTPAEGGSRTIPSETAANGDNQSSHNHRLQRWTAAGAVVLAVVGAGYLEVRSVLETRHHHQALINAWQNNENELFATYTKNGTLNTANSAMVLNSGVKLRSTPTSIDAKGNQRIIPGNLVETIPEGDQVLVTAAIWKVDKNGTWLGFTLKDPEPNSTSKNTVRPSDIAQNYVWFNYGQIADETNADGQPFVSERRFAHTSTKLATESAQIDAAGNVTEASAGAPAAYGVQIKADRLRKIFNMLHINNTPSAPQVTPTNN